MDERAKVLVVDDDEDIRGLVRALLERAGYDVDDAEDGRVALRRLYERPPALVILDVNMVQAIKQSKGTRADVTSQVFKINLKNSILGNLSFNKNGDVTANPVTIYQVKNGKSTTYKVIVPPNSLVKAA